MPARLQSATYQIVERVDGEELPSDVTFCFFETMKETKAKAREIGAPVCVMHCPAGRWTPQNPPPPSTEILIDGDLAWTVARLRQVMTVNKRSGGQCEAMEDGRYTRDVIVLRSPGREVAAAFLRAGSPRSDRFTPID